MFEGSQKNCYFLQNQMKEVVKSKLEMVRHVGLLSNFV